MCATSMMLGGLIKQLRFKGRFHEQLGYPFNFLAADFTFQRRFMNSNV